MDKLFRSQKSLDVKHVDDKYKSHQVFLRPTTILKTLATCRVSCVCIYYLNILEEKSREENMKMMTFVHP